MPQTPQCPEKGLQHHRLMHASSNYRKALATNEVGIVHMLGQASMLALGTGCGMLGQASMLALGKGCGSFGGVECMLTYAHPIGEYSSLVGMTVWWSCISMHHYFSERARLCHCLFVRFVIIFCRILVWPMCDPAMLRSLALIEDVSANGRATMFPG